MGDPRHGALRTATSRRGCRRHPGRVILGIDAREGKVAVEGWTEATGDVLDVARQYEGWTCALVYTDIAVTG